MNTKHTPGPWRIEKLPNGLQRIRAKAPTAPGYDHHYLIAELPKHRLGSYDLIPEKDNAASKGHDQTANARLIAAAPELLEALERYVEADTGIDDELTAMARAAIAKATGHAAGSLG